MALQEHFSDASTTTKVSVNLEGGMGIVEVVIDATGILVGAVGGAVLESILEYGVGMVAIKGACPEVDLPSH